MFQNYFLNFKALNFQLVASSIWFIACVLFSINLLFEDWSPDFAYHVLWVLEPQGIVQFVLTTLQISNLQNITTPATNLYIIKPYRKYLRTFVHSIIWYLDFSQESGIPYQSQSQLSLSLCDSHPQSNSHFFSHSRFTPLITKVYCCLLAIPRLSELFRDLFSIFYYLLYKAPRWEEQIRKVSVICTALLTILNMSHNRKQWIDLSQYPSKFFIVLAESRFKQQKLPAWKPLPTANVVLPIVFILGAACVGIGVALVLASASGQFLNFFTIYAVIAVKETFFLYGDECLDQGLTCLHKFNIPTDYEVS